MSFSIVTSLYRSEQHLEAFTQHATTFSQHLAAANIPVEFIFVVNDATQSERTILATLEASSQLEMTVLFVPRETLYASWNRGVAAAQYDRIGFWNVDDIRESEAAIAAHHAFEVGAELVDMPFQSVNLQTGEIIQRQPFAPEHISPKTIMSTFVFFTRQLYDKADAFNPHFKIAGDFEWCMREPVRNAAYTILKDTIGGHFQIHEGNLSNGTHPLEWVEINIVLLWHGLAHKTRPVDPDLMQEAWETWGYTGATLREETKRWLWGKGSRERYEAYTRERNQHPLWRRARLSLARRGLIHSIEWEADHREP